MQGGPVDKDRFPSPMSVGSAERSLSVDAAPIGAARRGGSKGERSTAAAGPPRINPPSPLVSPAHLAWLAEWTAASRDRGSDHDDEAAVPGGNAGALPPGAVLACRAALSHHISRRGTRAT